MADPRLPEIRTTARTTGRRKTSIARVRLALGTGQYNIHGRSLEEYFPRETLRTLMNQPFEATGAAGRQELAEARGLLDNGKATDAIVRFDQVLGLDAGNRRAADGKKEAQDRILATKNRQAL